MISILKSAIRNQLTKNGVVLPPWVYETEVGFKYRGTGYHSHLFDIHTKYAIEMERTGLQFDDLLIPPDGLKNQHSSSGISISHSPHFYLMKGLECNEARWVVRYIELCNLGLLDNRRPFQIDMNYLKATFIERKALLKANIRFDVFVYKLSDKGDKFIIADGKHRAAFAAFNRSRHSLYLKFITNQPFKEVFFRRYYRKILNGNPVDYSRNHNIIDRMLLHETA